jgi:hypothetical protein
VKPLLAALLLNLFYYELFEVWIRADLLEVIGWLSVTGSPLLCSSLIWDDDAYHICFKGIAVDESLGDDRDLVVEVLDLLWGDILSLGEFENVLLSVDDFD